MHAELVLLIWMPTLRQHALFVPPVAFLFPMLHFVVLAQLALQMKTTIHRQPAVSVRRDVSRIRLLRHVQNACLVKLTMITIRLHLADFVRLDHSALVEQHGAPLAQQDLLQTL